MMNDDPALTANDAVVIDEVPVDAVNENDGSLPMHERGTGVSTPGRVPMPRDFTGKLPDEFVQEWVRKGEEFIALWNECLSFDLVVPYLIDLGYDEPFFGSLSRRIMKLRSAEVPTAGVCVDRGQLMMLWNPIFFKKGLDECHIQGVLKHELYHVILEHITSRRQTPHVLWNAATDLAINSLIPRQELPDWCLHAGEMYKPAKAPPDWKPGIMARIIKGLPKNQSSEWYMNQFLMDPEVQQAMANARAAAGQRPKQGEGDGGGAGGPGQPGDGQDGGQKSNDGAFEDELRRELYGDGGGQFDDHDIWDRLTEEQRDVMREHVRGLFRDCVREAESNAKGWGNMPDSIRAHLRKVLSREIDWRDLISRFVGRSTTTKTTSSIKRVNRRYPWDHPGRKRAHSARPVFLMDQSGSMRDEWVELLFAEVSNMGVITEYDIVPFDHTVDEENVQRVRRGTQPKLVRTRSGGTNFSAAVEWVNKCPGRHDVAFLLTDGECFSPVKCNIPLAYILAPGCQLHFEPPAGTIVINMTDTRKG